MPRKDYFFLKLNKQVIDNSIDWNKAKLLRFYKNDTSKLLNQKIIFLISFLVLETSNFLF